MTVLDYDKTSSRDNHPTSTPVNLGIDHCFEIHHWPWSCLMIDSKALDLSDHLVTFSVPLNGGYAKANPANPGDGVILLMMLIQQCLNMVLMDSKNRS